MEFFKKDYIREKELTTELLKILDKVNINELGMKQELENEITRFNIFQRSVLGSTDKVSNRKDADIRNYTKYIRKERSDIEKSEYWVVLRVRFYCRLHLLHRQSINLRLFCKPKRIDNLFFKFRK